MKFWAKGFGEQKDELESFVPCGCECFSLSGGCPGQRAERTRAVQPGLGGLFAEVVWAPVHWSVVLSAQNTPQPETRQVTRPFLACISIPWGQSLPVTLFYSS